MIRWALQGLAKGWAVKYPVCAHTPVALSKGRGAALFRRKLGHMWLKGGDMNRRILGLLTMFGLCGLMVSMCPSSTSAEAVNIGTHQVTRYSVTSEAPGRDEPIAFGEIAVGPADGVRFEVVSTQREMSLSRSEAQAVHELLGTMLAMSSPSDTPQTPAGPQTDAVGSPTRDTPPPDDKPRVHDTPDTAGKPDKNPFLGMNLADVTYYSRAWVFTDLMFQSDAWRKGGSGHIFKTGYAPPGQYICTWSGNGSIRFGGDAEANPTGSNSAQVTISTGERGIDMSTVGQVSDVSLIRIEHETRISPFQPEFLDRLAPFKVIRFMDWANTNNSEHQRWAGRARKGQVTQARGGGVAIEYMIALSNELGADPWFCIPHKADDEYIRRHAELVRDRLHPDAKVYIEYSNEVWNTQFKQHGYIRQLSGGDTYSDEFFDAWSERCRRTFAIWAQVFGDDANRRLVRVAAVHLQNPWVAQKLLPRLQGEFDAVAPSAYFGITRKQGKRLTPATTADDILGLCEQNIRQDNRGWYDRHGQIARDWSSKLGRPIHLISYEAGQHLSANGDDNLPYYDALIRAQSHPRMYGLYLLNMRLLEQAGGNLFTAFNDVSKPGKFGSWGHIEYQTQPIEDAPKYNALIDYPSIRNQYDGTMRWTRVLRWRRSF